MDENTTKELTVHSLLIKMTLSITTALTLCVVI